MENLEGRMLCSVSSPAAATGVTLTRVGRTSRPLSTGRTTWVVVPGLGAKLDDAGVRALAAGIDSFSSKDQVMIANWQSFGQTNVSGRQVDRNLQSAADSLAARLRKMGLTSSRINLIGHSMGALVADRTAAALRSRGGVNSIVALDPASPKIGHTAKGHVRRAAYHLNANSRYALAFHAGDRLSPAAAAMTADDTVLVQFAGGYDDVMKHKAVFDVFSTMAKRNGSARAGAISGLFSVGRIAADDLPGWQKNRYAGGYEAILQTTGKPGGVSPAALTYAERGTQRKVQGS